MSKPLRSNSPSMPPCDMEAEQALLGSICLSESALAEVASITRPAHFYSEANRLVYAAILQLDHAGVQPDVVTLRARLDEAGQLATVGGDAALVRILECVPHAAHAIHYAAILRDRWQERELRHACQQCLSDDRRNIPVAERIGRLDTDCQRILQEGLPAGPVTAEEALVALQQRWDSGEASGAPTGYSRLDKLLGGLRPGSVTVLAARPGNGKTALSCCIARRFAVAGLPVLLVSLEMSKTEIAQRLLSLSSGIPFKQLNDPGNLDAVGHDMVVEAMQSLSGLPLAIDDSAEISVRHIAAVLRLHQRKHGLKLAIVDYLQLIQPSNKAVPREQQVAEASRELKVIARELKIPILLLAQLNRGVENRESQKPRLSDLRESGAIEQDADAVVFIWQPRDEDENHKSLLVAKNRHGPTGDVPMHWRGATMTFSELTGK